VVHNYGMVPGYLAYQRFGGPRLHSAVRCSFTLSGQKAVLIALSLRRVHPVPKRWEKFWTVVRQIRPSIHRATVQQPQSGGATAQLLWCCVYFPQRGGVCCASGVSPYRVVPKLSPSPRHSVIPQISVEKFVYLSSSRPREKTHSHELI